MSNFNYNPQWDEEDPSVEGRKKRLKKAIETIEERLLDPTLSEYEREMGISDLEEKKGLLD